MGGQYGRVRRVQRDAFAGQQLAVGGLLQQRMAKGVGIVGAGDEHVVKGRLAQGDHEIAGLDATDRREQVMADPPAGDRGHPYDCGGCLRKRRETRRQYVRKTRWQLWPAARREQLLGEKRIALGALDDRGDDRRRQ